MSLHKRYIFFLLLTFFFLIVNVTAQPPFQSAVGGLTLLVPTQEVRQAGQNYTFIVHTFNTTDGALINTTNLKCIFNLVNPRGTHLVEMNMSPDATFEDMRLLVLSGNFTAQNGLYNVMYSCAISGVGGGFDNSFEVTTAGAVVTTASSISVFIPLILMFLLTMAFLFLAGMVGKKEYKWTFIILAAGFFILTISYGITASTETLSHFSSLDNWIVALIKIVSLTVTGGIIIAAVIAIIVVIKKLFQIRMGEQK